MYNIWGYGKLCVLQFNGNLKWFENKILFLFLIIIYIVHINTSTISSKPQLQAARADVC